MPAPMSRTAPLKKPSVSGTVSLAPVKVDELAFAESKYPESCPSTTRFAALYPSV